MFCMELEHLIYVLSVVYIDFVHLKETLSPFNV